MIELSRLSLFLNVARSGSLTRAAQVTGSAPPVLSRQISALEEHIGGQLFIRTGRGLELSVLGQTLLPKAEELLRAAETLEADARVAAGAAMGEVRIGMMASFAGTIGIDLMTRVAEDFPAIRLKIFEAPTGRIDEWLDIGMIDIAVTLRDSQVEIGDEQCIAELETFLVGKSGAPCLSAETIDFKDLAGVPLILSATPSGLRQTLDRMAAEHGIELNVRFEADSAAVHLELARRGLGFAVMTPQAAMMNARTADYGYAQIVNPGIERRVLLGNSIKRAPSAAVQSVMAIIAETGARLAASGAWLSLDGAASDRPNPGQDSQG